MRVLPLYTHWVSCCRVVAKSIQALYNNFWLRPTWDTHPPYKENCDLTATIYPLVWSTTIYPQCMSTLYPLSISVPSSVDHIIPTSSPPYKHLRCGEHYPYISNNPLLLHAMIHYNYNIDDLLIIWFYLNYNPTLPMHPLFVVHLVKGTLVNDRDQQHISKQWYCALNSHSSWSVFTLELVFLLSCAP